MPAGDGLFPCPPWDDRAVEPTTKQVMPVKTEPARLARAFLLGELTASIAHEVKQPLTGVITNAEACLRWLAGDSPNIAEATEGLRRIMRDAMRANEVINRVRSLLKNTKPVMAEVRLEAVIRETLSVVDAEARRRGVSVRTEIGPNLPPVLADAVQLQQVLLNLVMNALDAGAGVTGRAPAIVVRAEKAGADLRVTVTDNGIGLSPEQVGHIFEPFFTTKDGGIGMGLPISRAIVEAHGGRLWAGRNEGAGIHVAFTIPAP
jgi:signal transduction histidine kinase